ncbi:MAG: sulfatase [Acidobacteriia bacterium]|nr:sulfatase [Terriglobia bacterium]
MTRIGPTFTRRSLLAAPALLLAQKSAPERPNILFIASDDMNNNLGCYGHPVVKSPNLDRLAAEGVRFDRAYCQYPVCGPSRASLLTGLRPDSTRIFENNIAVREKMPDVVTLPQLFKNNGWHSVRAGKMYHMDVPGSVGTNKWDDPPSWDVSISPPGKEQHTVGEGRNITEGRRARWEWVSFQGEGKDQADDRASEIAMETMAAKNGKPWFLGLGYLRPHVPHVAPARFFDLYPLSQIQTVVNPPGDLDDIPLASEITINTRAKDMGMNEAEKKEAIRAYYASISYMDWQVGRVIGELEKRNLRRNTVIVFWGDHGWHLGEHHRWHKRSLFEESMRAPLIISAQGRKGNGKSSQSLVEFVDIYPTVAELGGLRPPPNLEGQSMVPLLDNPGRAFKKAAFSVVTAPDGIMGRAAVTDRHRYIRWTGPHPDEELFDHKNDPREFTNLARMREHAALLQRMRAVMDAGWRGAKAT